MSAQAALYFDFDGTLVDTLPGLVTATNALRAQADLEAVPTDTVRAWIGGGLDVLLAGALETERAAIRGAQRRRFLDFYMGPPLDDSQPYAGVEAMLDSLADWPLAIVTNKARPSVDRLLERLDWRDRFAAVVTPDDAGLRKPDPAFVALAARKLGTAGGPGILFGDSEFDLHAAHNAGLTAAAVTWGYRDRDTLAAAEPHVWFDAPAQITPAACAAFLGQPQ